MEFEEKTLKSEVVFDGKVMKVLKDQIELADGYKSFREVVVHNGGVVVVALKNNDTILLVKQFRYPLKSVSFELPAGKLELNEDPNEACKRELEEETGYQAKIWKSLGYIHTSPGFCTEKLYLYLASDLEFVGEHPDEGEIVKTLEFSKSEVLEMIHNGTINDSKTICAIFRAFK
jgi:ADP-ribose pyrophosphatase